MRFKILGLGLVSLVLFNCQKVEEVKKPKNLIAHDEMVNILVDLAKIEGARNTNLKKFEEYGGEQVKSMLFEKYGIDSLQLMESSAYYARNLKMNDSIYRRVVKELERESDSLRAVKEKNREDKESDNEKE